MRRSAHTTPDADFCLALTKEISPGKAPNLSLRADWLYLARLDDLWASLFPANSRPTPGLAARRVFLRSKVCYPLLSASPRGYALRFTTVAVIGSGWPLSSNKIRPMLGTLGRTPTAAAVDGRSTQPAQPDQVVPSLVQPVAPTVSKVRPV